MYMLLVPSLLYSPCGKTAVHEAMISFKDRVHLKWQDIRESVDSLCRDGSGSPIVCVRWKAVLTRERSCSKPF